MVGADASWGTDVARCMSVTYRDDAEALRARLQVVEAELQEAKGTILRLRGEARSEQPDDDIDPVTGIGRFLRHERHVPFAVTDERLAAIAKMLEHRIPGGAILMVGRTLRHSWGYYTLRIHRSEVATTIELTSDYRARRALLLLGAPHLAVITAIFAAALGAAMTRGDRSSIALSVAIGAIGSVVGLRELMRRTAKRERDLLTGVFEATVDLALLDEATPLRFGAVGLAFGPAFVGSDVALGAEDGTPARRIASHVSLPSVPFRT